MSVAISATTSIHKSGTMTHTVRIVDDDAGKELVMQSGSSTGPGKQPTLQHVARIALERLQRLAREAEARLLEHGLVEQPPPTGGPYR